MGKKGKICENCGSEFASEVGWLQHVRGGRCQKLEDMSESQLKARRATRAKAVLESGEKIFEAEPVEVRSCNGGVAKACGSFLYLGSLTDNKGSSGPEIRMRIKKATETFRRLWRVWPMKGFVCTRRLFIPCFCIIARFGTLLRQKCWWEGMGT